MSYAASYCLFNYTLDRPSEGPQYANLRLVRAFERGLDPQSSEAGFVLTHVDMVKETAALVSGTVKILDALEQGGTRCEVNDGFREILHAMGKIEERMEGKTKFLPCVLQDIVNITNLHSWKGMWKNSKPADYISFRVFIFGITSQSMFPNGVVYESINDNKPLYFRGESGANDSIVCFLWKERILIEI